MHFNSDNAYDQCTKKSDGLILFNIMLVGIWVKIYPTKNRPWKISFKLVTIRRIEESITYYGVVLIAVEIKVFFQRS